MTDKKPKRESRVPEGETPNARFRRVIDVRLRTLLKKYDSITNMVKQPSYAPSQNDLKLVILAVQDAHDEFIQTFGKALKGKQKKEKSTGVDWNEQIEENTGDDANPDA